MTRIGRGQIKTHNLLAMHPTGETISPRSKFPQIASINTTMPPSLGYLAGVAKERSTTIPIAITRPDPQLFF
jgi:hypothetical protein